MLRNEQELVRVRRLLGASRGRTGRRLYSREAKSAAATFGREERKSGVTVAAVAKSLGVHPITLGEWIRNAPQSEASRFVAVTLESERPASPLPATQAIVVHSASGLRIEGLSMAEVARLLREVQ